MEREVKTYVLKRSDDEAAPRTLSIDYAAALNSQQLAAVTAGEGPSLVIAGAGSGKTRTLVYRVAYLIDSGVDPSNILLLTFTRKSAQEMLQRAGELKAPRGAKAGLVLAAIREQSGEFRLADIEQACPGVGREWIRSLLTELKVAGEATCRGKGPAARWTYLGSKGTNS